MKARDELALELFIGDNFNQPREASIADWEYFHAEGRFQGRVEPYEVMADAVLTAGYRKPVVLAYVVVDRNGKLIKDFGQDKATAQEFAIESTGTCEDAGIDWDYRVAEIVEAGQ